MSADMVISRKRKRKTRIISSCCCCFSLAQLLMLEIQYQGRGRRSSSGHYFSDAIQCLIHWVLPQSLHTPNLKRKLSFRWFVSVDYDPSYGSSYGVIIWHLLVRQAICWRVVRFLLLHWSWTFLCTSCPSYEKEKFRDFICSEFRFDDRVSFKFNVRVSYKHWKFEHYLFWVS